MTLILIGLLAAAAVTDLTTRRVPNTLVLLIAICAVVRTALLSGLVSALGALGLALGVLGVAVLLWRNGFLGGGDAKLTAATSCAVGAAHFLPFLGATAISGGGLALAIWAFAPARTRRSIAAGLLSLVPGAPGTGSARLPRRVPFAAAIAFGGAWALLRG